MSSSLDISAPATLSVLAGSSLLSSLDILPPDGLSISGATASRVTVQVFAANAAAELTASGAAGATIISTGQSLSISGSLLQVNAALASFEDAEPASVTADAITVTVSDASQLPAQTSFRVDVLPVAAPAFVAPPKLVTLQPDALDSLPPLLLSDPIAGSLAQAGLGREETLNLTLAVTSGLLFLGDYDASSPITASGLGTGEIILSFTADDIGALNTLLTSLQFAGPTIAGGEHLSYDLRNAAGVLPYVLTSGNIFLYAHGAPGSNGAFSNPNQTFIEGDETLTAAAALPNVTGILGNLDATQGLVLLPDASLQLPGNALFLGGSSLDFGNITSDGLDLSGALVAGDGADFTGPVQLETFAELDFNGLFVADGDDVTGPSDALNLAAGAIFSGGGMLVAGNFSESDDIIGPGTLLVPSGETLIVSAGDISGSADLAVASGAAMVLGPISPLYGIFNTTPLTIDSSVTLSFLSNAGAVPLTGAYAGSLGGAGGAFVITGPQVFAGTITGFLPGDELVFPGLSDISPYNISGNGFMVGGLSDSDGSPVTYSIVADIAADYTVIGGFDAEGDPIISLRAPAPTLSQDVIFVATAGIPQPLLGLNLEIEAPSAQNLVLTLSATRGDLSDGGIRPAGRITLSATSVTAMDISLANLLYTYTGNSILADTLTLTSNAGLLAGLVDYFGIGIAPGGPVNAYSLPAYSEAQVAQFGPGYPLIFSTPAAPGELYINGTTEFASLLEVYGISGTAMLVDGNATAVFSPAADAQLASDITLGDPGGAGTLAITTQSFTSSGNLTITGDPGGAGSAAFILGSLNLAGGIADGLYGNGMLDLGGSLTAAALDIYPDGGLFAYGGASATLGVLDDMGNAALDGTSQIDAGGLISSGGISLGGSATLDITGLIQGLDGTNASIGPDNVLNAGSIELFGGSYALEGDLADLGTLIEDGAFTLQGGTLTAPTLFLGATIAGYGIVNTGLISGTGAIIAAGGVLTTGGSLASAITPEIESGGALDLTQGFAGSPILFLGGDALLTLNQLAPVNAPVRDFSATDAIDLPGITPNLIHSTGSSTVTLDVTNSLGSQMAMLIIDVATLQPALTVTSDNAGGSLITLGDELPCFARGTGLLTPHGYRAVETLKPGDPLITASGVSRPVRWIGRRTLDLGPTTARFALPVLVLPNAFGPGQPARPLRLSPLHCIHADGVLVPVTHLVNGATIIREQLTAAMTYFHIELDRHDILLAEGLPCESYFDSGNRGALYQEVGRRSPARKSFAPSITKGPSLARIRRRLHQNALAAGFALTYWPVIRAVSDGQASVPNIERIGGRRMAHFSFDRPVREVWLISNTASPADTDPSSEDRRELGICLEKPGFLELGQGFYPRDPRDEGYWMGKTADIRMHEPGLEFSLPLAAVVQSWVRPVIDATPPSR